jgi:hypothetical protein
MKEDLKQKLGWWRMASLTSCCPRMLTDQSEELPRHQCRSPEKGEIYSNRTNWVDCCWDRFSTLEYLSVLLAVPDSESEILVLFFLLSGADVVSPDCSCYESADLSPEA